MKKCSSKRASNGELKKTPANMALWCRLRLSGERTGQIFSILHAERQYGCVVELENEGRAGKSGIGLTLPANVLEPPPKIAGLL